MFQPDSNGKFSAITRKELAAKIKADIDDFCVKEFQEDPRNHIGASIIGDECTARAWFAFRWMKQEAFSGRMYRLFNRGHLEELRFVRWLKGIGCEVYDVDPQSNSQYRMKGVRGLGHYGGSLDGIARMPRYIPSEMALLLEFKTHNEKSFLKLVKDGVIISKPQHFAQMCAYGKHYQFQYALYVAVNKNDDELYIEIVELDWNYAHMLENKSHEIVTAQSRPPRISESPTYRKCNMCDYKGICHLGERPTKNCRSCNLAQAIDGGKWYCNRWQSEIPQHVIPQGCDGYAPL